MSLPLVPVEAKDAPCQLVVSGTSRKRFRLIGFRETSSGGHSSTTGEGESRCADLNFPQLVIIFGFGVQGT